MLVVFGFLDRILDMVGLVAITLWSIKATKWYMRRKHDLKT